MLNMQSGGARGLELRTSALRRQISPRIKKATFFFFFFNDQKVLLNFRRRGYKKKSKHIKYNLNMIIFKYKIQVEMILTALV